MAKNMTVSVRFEPQQVAALKRLAIEESVKRNRSTSHSMLVREAVEAKYFESKGASNE
jgi:hypothetical protein